MSFIYLAGPLSHPNPAVVHARAAVHEEAAVVMTKLGLTVYSPIASWYRISRDHGLSTCPFEWKTHNKNMVIRSGLIRVLDLPGLDDSVGTNMEREWARELGIGEELYNPEELSTYKHFEKTLCG